MRFPKTHRAGQGVRSPNRFEDGNQRYSTMTLGRVKKSINDKLQRTYEDFEMETDDSVVEVEKAPKTQMDLRKS